ncbi:hypothetical protein E2C01_050064 [Portunus trituberculatus]|uniref:Uncharacterized protein n=1 Tax=Portunus trituberculatus TaxID=210409 RepID=A0A5B7G7Z6_PORTR|nr:hypothetical protein [Portunus trituberculatus]
MAEEGTGRGGEADDDVRSNPVVLACGVAIGGDGWFLHITVDDEERPCREGVKDTPSPPCPHHDPLPTAAPWPIAPHLLGRHELGTRSSQAHFWCNHLEPVYHGDM